MEVEELIEQLRDAAKESRRRAEMARIVYDHFYPQYIYHLNSKNEYHHKEALRLYPYVIDQKHDMNSWEKDAVMMDEAADLIEKGLKND